MKILQNKNFLECNIASWSQGTVELTQNFTNNERRRFFYEPILNYEDHKGLQIDPTIKIID